MKSHVTDIMRFVILHNSVVATRPTRRKLTLTWADVQAEFIQFASYPGRQRVIEPQLTVNVVPTNRCIQRHDVSSRYVSSILDTQYQSVLTVAYCEVFAQFLRHGY